MRRSSIIVAALFATIWLGACGGGAPEQEEAKNAPSTHREQPSTEEFTIIAYRLSPGVTDDEVTKRIDAGEDANDLAARGILASVRYVQPTPTRVPRTGEFQTLDDQTLYEDEVLWFSLFQAERAYVFHSPPSSSCRDVRFGATSQILRAFFSGIPPQVRVEFAWSTDGTRWHTWDRYEMYQWIRTVSVWAGADRPRFRYHVVNHAFTFSAGGITEPGERDIMMAASPVSASRCGR